MHIHAVERGRGNPLVLIHGNFGDHLDWGPVVEPLAEHFRVIAIDAPGYGQSDKPDVAYDRNTFADAFDDFMGARGLREVTVMGHSLGGQMALALGIAHPDRIRRLVLVDAGGLFAYSEAQVAMLQPHYSEAVLRDLTPEQARVMFSALFANSTSNTAAYVDRQISRLSLPDWPDVVRAAARGFRFHVEFSIASEPEKVRWPTLLVWGEQDRLLPVLQAHAILPLMPNAQLEVIPDCGHCPQIEKPDEFLKRVLPFLQAT